MDPAPLLALLLRAFGLLAFLPLGDGVAAVGLKGALAIVLALLSTGLTATSDHLTGAAPPGMLVSEFVIGAFLALPAIIVLEGAVMIGELFDALHGASLAQVYDPISHHQMGASGVLAKNLVWTALVLQGGALALVRGYGESVRALPPLSLPVETLAEIGHRSLLITAAALDTSVRALLPLALSALLFEIAAILVARAASRLSIHSELPALRCTLSALLLLTATPWLPYHAIASAMLPPVEALSSIAAGSAYGRA